MRKEHYSIITVGKDGRLCEIQATQETLQDKWDNVKTGVCYRWLDYGYMPVGKKKFNGFIDHLHV
jgi:hypothetical protein